MCQARGSSLRPEAPPWEPAPASGAAPAHARGRGRGARKGRQPRPRSAAQPRDAPAPRASMETPDLGAPIGASTWPCPLCTFANSCDVFTCAMCNVGTYGGRVCADVGGSDDAAASGGGASGARPGRRGRDGTHLLNFSVAHETPPDDIPPRRARPPHSARAGGAPRSAARLDRFATREPPAAMRQRFMLANFQFILGGSEPTGRRGAADPDAPIEWDRVRAVRLVTSEEVRHVDTSPTPSQSATPSPGWPGRREIPDARRSAAQSVCASTSSSRRKSRRAATRRAYRARSAPPRTRRPRRRATRTATRQTTTTRAAAAPSARKSSASAI